MVGGTSRDQLPVDAICKPDCFSAGGAVIHGSIKLCEYHTSAKGILAYHIAMLVKKFRKKSQGDPLLFSHAYANYAATYLCFPKVSVVQNPAITTNKSFWMPYHGPIMFGVY